MMSTAPAVCLFILACVLASGQARIFGSYSPPLETSSLSMAKSMCSDCTKIIELFSDMVSRPETQDLIGEALSELCQRLPAGKDFNDCLDFVKNYLPTVIQRFIRFTTHKEGQICMMLGLCAVQPEYKAPELLGAGLQPSTGTDHELQVSPQCTFCLFLMKKLEDMLPKERTEESVVKLLEKICDHLPAHYKEQCDSILEKYGKQIIDLLISTATPHAICTLLHMCFGQDTPAEVTLHSLVPSLPSDCKNCKVLMILTQAYLGQNTSESEMTSLLWKTCHRHPNAIPGCEQFIQSHVTALVNILSKQEEAVNACQTFFCVGHE